MIATSHVIIGGAVGIAVGSVTRNPAAALAAGFIAHIICDAIPHLDSPPGTKIINGKAVWDKKLFTFALTDSLFAFFLILFLWFKYYHLYFFAPFAWGALGSYLPDLIDVFPVWNEQLQKLSLFKQFHSVHLAVHHFWQKKYPMPKYWILGTFSQIIFIIPCLWYILK